MPRLLIVDDTPLNLAAAAAMLRTEFDCTPERWGAPRAGYIRDGSQVTRPGKK